MAYQLLMDHLMPKASFQKNSSEAIKTRNWRVKGIHTFPKGISPKVNVIAWVEFELVYFKVADQHVIHYTNGDSSR